MAAGGRADIEVDVGGSGGVRGCGIAQIDVDAAPAQRREARGIRGVGERRARLRECRFELVLIEAPRAGAGDRRVLLGRGAPLRVLNDLAASFQVFILPAARRRQRVRRRHLP